MAANGSVIVYKGRFLYGVVNVFAEQIAEGFRLRGYEPHLVDLSNLADFPAAMHKALSKGDCRLVFSFASVGASFTTPDGALLHDKLGVPFVAAMVDHPGHFLDRYAPARILIGCYDPSHLDYLSLRFGGSKRSFHLPHGGSPPPEPFQGPWKERPFEIVFPASYMDTETLEAKVKAMPEMPRRIIDAAVEGSDPFDEIPTHLAVMNAAKSFGVDFAKEGVFSFVLDQTLATVEHLIRGRRRMALLKILDDAGLAVDIYGEGWRQGLFKNHRLRGKLDFDGVLNVMARSKIVFNARAIPGSHERIPSGMMAGALVLSDFSSCVASEFSDGEELRLYRWTRRASLPEIVKGVLADAEGSARIAAQGMGKAKRDCSWQGRAGLVLRELGLPDSLVG